MASIHAIRADGTIVRGVDVFREAYQLVGFGWVYSITKNKTLKPLFDHIYDFWAHYRPWMTRGTSLENLTNRKVAKLKVDNGSHTNRCTSNSKCAISANAFEK